MKAYIRIRHTGELYDRSCYAAYAGANELDIPVKPYKVVYSLTDNDPKDPVVGTFSDVKVALERFGVKLLPLDYPDELMPFVGRKIWKSTLFTIISEWRLWVLQGEIVGLCPYKGRWDVFPDPSVLKAAVAAYHSAPAGYALDFGITDEGKTLLVEVSDGYALASFGLKSRLYMQILLARWQELTKDVKV